MDILNNPHPLLVFLMSGTAAFTIMTGYVTFVAPRLEDLDEPETY